MTPEERVERLERIAKLFARAGRKVRTDVRDQDEKINILIDLHMQNQESFARNEERLRENEVRFKEWLSKNEWLFATQDEKIQFILEMLKQTQERFREDETRFARNDERFAQLVASQLAADRRLNLLLELIRMDRKNH